MRKLFLVLLTLMIVNLDLDSARAAEPGWSPVIIATGAYRDKIRATPIERRPYRPFHFYGNAVRRRYYRGTALPLPRDLGADRIISAFTGGL